jgi:hypothetical protein
VCSVELNAAAFTCVYVKLVTEIHTGEQAFIAHCKLAGIILCKCNCLSSLILFPAGFNLLTCEVS